MASTHDYNEDPRNKDIRIYVDGKFFTRNNAKVSVMDSGYLLGDGVWEGLRYHKGQLLHVDDHLDRLFIGAKNIQLDIGLSKSQLKAIIVKTLKINNMFSGVHIRLIVSRGIKSTPYQHPKVTIGPPTIVIIPEYKTANKKLLYEGITLGTVKTIRDYRVQDPRINSLSKHNCISACIEADNMGVDEALMLDSQGYVSTCNSTNFFMINGNQVWTSKGKNCLNGVTRKQIIRLCNENGIEVFEKDFVVSEVHNADEAFVTGTFAGIIPVSLVDNIRIGSGKCGYVTKKLQKIYRRDIGD